MNIFWFRRDLRLDDNAGLFHALQQTEGVLPIFIFDTSILGQLPNDDARVTFIHEQLEKIQNQIYKTDLKMSQSTDDEYIVEKILAK